MASVNKVILVGHLGKDPETRYLPNGDQTTTITLATSDTWKDKQTGEKKEATEWHRVVFWRKLAEIAGQYLKKGALVYVEGALKTRKWQDKNGQDRYTTEIVADTMQMLGGKSGGSSAPEPSPSPAPQRSAQGAPPADDGFGDDIHFSPIRERF